MPEITSFDYISNIAITILLILLVSFVFYVIAYWCVRFYIWYLRFKNRSVSLDKKVFFRIKVPQDNEIPINNAEQMFTSFFGLRKSGFLNSLKEQDSISFEIVGTQNSIDFYVVCPESLESLVEKQLNANYHDAELTKVKPYNIWKEEGHVKFSSLVLKKSDYLPITTYENLKVDSMALITSSLSKLHKDESLALQIIIRPAEGKWQEAGKDKIKAIQSKMTSDDGKPRGTRLDEEQMEAIRNKISKIGYESVIRLVSVSPDEASCKTNLLSLERSILQLNTTNLNSFTKSPRRFDKYFAISYIARMFPVVKEIILPVSIPHFLNKKWMLNYSIFNTEELATLWHLPGKEVKTPRINWLLSKGSSAPIELPESGLYMGKSEFRGQEVKIFTEEDDRRRHMYILGTTGTGKSEFLKFMAVQDIKAGRGVAFIDPHGTAVSDVLEQIPRERMDDVIYFDPSSDRPMGLNMLDVNTEKSKDMVVNKFIDMLYELYDPNRQGIMGPQLERALRMSMLTAMSKPGGTLVEVARLLVDENFHRTYLSSIKDPQVLSYWIDEVANTPKARRGETMGYFVSKLDRFVTEKTMRYILGQQKSSIDFNDIMDNKKILLVDLSKGRMGEENSRFLGLILVPRLLVAAFSRIERMDRGEKIEDFYLYIDEFQNYTTPDVATILSEARKYKLNLIVANQFIGQLPEKIKDAIFGNVGTIGAFRVGTDDAEYLEKYFEPTFTRKDLINNKVGRLYMRLLVRGQPTPPFAMTTDWEEMQNSVRNHDLADEIKKLSYQKYGRNRFIVEQEIRHRSKF